jgi:hypothetical protein
MNSVTLGRSRESRSALLVRETIAAVPPRLESSNAVCLLDARWRVLATTPTAM